MTENDLLHYCRYYKGQKRNPYKSGNDAMFWEYEKYWVLQLMEHEKDADDPPFAEYVDDYIRAGLSELEYSDDTPITLKALLFNRYGNTFSGSMMECAASFKKFYQHGYHNR